MALSTWTDWFKRLFFAGVLSFLLAVIGVFYLSTLPVPTPPPSPIAGMPEVHYAPSADGWELALSHYPPCWRGGCRQDAIPEEPLTPVILCHGMAVNRHNWDLSEGRSLARYLASRGFDVWNLELRGHGLSRNNGRTDPAPWGLKEYMEEDMPAAIDYVRQKTGAEKVHWVGHSMGGLILMGHLAHHPDSPIESGVIASSPGHLRDREGRLGMILSALPALPEVGMALPTPDGLRLVARVSGKPAMPEIAWVPENVEAEAGQWFMANGMEPVQEGELAAFTRMLEVGDLESRDGKIAYHTMYKNITTPLLFMVGAADQLANPASVQHLYDEAGSEDKKFILLARSEGFSADYGHGDVCIGDKSEAEIFPLIKDWIAAHRPRPQESDKSPIPTP